MNRKVKTYFLLPFLFFAAGADAFTADGAATRAGHAIHGRHTLGSDWQPARDYQSGSDWWANAQRLAGQR